MLLQHDTVFAGVKLRVERKVAKEYTPRRVPTRMVTTPCRPTMRNATASGTPTTPDSPAPVSPIRHSRAEPSPSVPAPAPSAWPWACNTGVLHASNYVTAPVSPFSLPPVSSGTAPMTPQASPGMINPYGYYSGFWQGVPFVQDPTTGMSYYTYGSPNALAGRQGEDIFNTPTRGPNAAGTGHEENCEPNVEA